MAQLTNETVKSLRLAALRLMLRPLVRFCLRGSHTLQEFVEAAKVVFVELAVEEMGRATTKINVSRISVMTGLNRKEVTALYREKRGMTVRTIGIIPRVMGQWESDKRFCFKPGKPRALTVEGDESEFRELVRSVSTNINPGTVLFEMERIGAVKRKKDQIALVKDVHRIEGDPTRGYELLARDIDSLIIAGEENILKLKPEPNMHFRTEYDNLYLKELPQIEQWLRDEGRAFHKRTREYLSQFDKDINPGNGGAAGGKVTVTAFSTSFTRIDGKKD